MLEPWEPVRVRRLLHLGYLDVDLDTVLGHWNLISAYLQGLNVSRWRTVAEFTSFHMLDLHQPHEPSAAL